MSTPPEAAAVSSTAGGLSRRAQNLLKLLMALAPTLFLLCLLEGSAAVWEQKQAGSLYAWELVASRCIDLEEYLSPGAGYTLMRPGRRYAYQGIPVEINSHGLRCPEFTPEKRDGVYRILNLGDSIAFGWGVEMEATYGQLLAKRAALPGDDQTTQMEVINAGAPGWNLENELAFLQDRGLEFQPDLLLLDVTLANDIIGKSALVTNQRPALIDWLRGHTKFWPLLTVQLRWLQARLQGRERIDVIDPPHQPEAYFPLSPTDERWVSLWKTIEEINRTAARHDIKMILVLFPLEDQVLDGTFPTTPQEVFRQRAAQAGIPVVDLLPAYQAACRAKPGGACTLEDRYLFADVWMHPSALGHQIAASELTKVIMQDIQFER